MNENCSLRGGGFLFYRAVNWIFASTLNNPHKFFAGACPTKFYRIIGLKAGFNGISVNILGKIIIKVGVRTAPIKLKLGFRLLFQTSDIHIIFLQGLVFFTFIVYNKALLVDDEFKMNF